MRYWKGKLGTPKEGQLGTVPDDGYVPDSVEATKEEYDVYVATFPVTATPLTRAEVLEAIVTEIDADSDLSMQMKARLKSLMKKVVLWVTV